MHTFFRSRRTLVALALVGVTALAIVAFGYFGVHTLFIDDEVSEAAPQFDQAPAAVDAPTTTVATTPPGSTAPTPSEGTGSSPDAPAPPTAAPSTTAAPTTTVPEVRTLFAGTFESDAHPTSGSAIVLGNGSPQRFLRFEDFATDNGPDLNVYLVNSSTGDVSDFVDLGDLTGNIGEQNYEIPADVDLDVYDEVVIWCVRFAVGFGDATLAPA